MTDIAFLKIKTPNGPEIAIFNQGDFRTPLVILDAYLVDKLNKEWKRKDV